MAWTGSKTQILTCVQKGKTNRLLANRESHLTPFICP